MSVGQRFLKREHLRLRRDFTRVLGAKCKASDPVLMVYVAGNELAFSRIGISVSKRIGNSVRRHYVKRRIREAFRRNKRNLPSGLDIICVARPLAAHATVDAASSFCKLVFQAASRCRTSNADRTGQSGPDAASISNG